MQWPEIDKDANAAAGWYAKAREAGHVKASTNLGILYWEGLSDGAAGMYEEARRRFARELWEEAAEAGVPEARRRKLSYAGLQALVRLLDGAKVQACTLLHVKLLDARSTAEINEVLGHCSTLLMRDCFSLTPVHLTALRELRVSYGALGTETLNSIVAACPPQLEGLILAGCSATTKDPFLAALGSAPCAQNLRRLDLAGMKKLTSQGFNGHIRDRLPRLEMLGLDGCDNVDMGEILFIHDTVAPFPALRRLHAARLAPSKRPYPGPWNEALQAGLAVDSCCWMGLTDVCLAGQCNGAWHLDRHKNPYWQGAISAHGDEAAAASIVCFERGAAVGGGASANSRDRAARAVTAASSPKVAAPAAVAKRAANVSSSPSSANGSKSNF